MSGSLWPHGLQNARLPCPSLSPWVFSNSCPLSWWCHPTISSSVIPFSCLQPFPASGSFPVNLCFASGGQSIGASALTSILQWIFRVDFLWDWLVWSLCCPRDCHELSPEPQFESINSLVSSLLYGPTLTCIHDCWKNHRFDNMDFYWQNDVPSFLIHDLS